MTTVDLGVRRGSPAFWALIAIAILIPAGKGSVRQIHSKAYPDETRS